MGARKISKLANINELWLEYGIKKPFEIPMEYFTLTINYAMRRYGINGENLN